MKYRAFTRHIISIVALLALAAQLQYSGTSVICLTSDGSARIEFSGDGQKCMVEPDHAHQPQNDFISANNDCGEDCRDIPLVFLAAQKTKRLSFQFPSILSTTVQSIQAVIQNISVHRIPVRSRDPAFASDPLSHTSVLLL